MKERPSYLSKYIIEWDLLDLIISGHSSLDSKYFIGPLHTQDDVEKFLKGYGIDLSDPVNSAELFGYYQEALQFVKRYLLKDGNPDGLDFKVPNSLYMITNPTEIFMMAAKTQNHRPTEEALWAEIMAKVMHVILHVDKDLRSTYFSFIQTQVFDRIYKYIIRDSENRLYLGKKVDGDAIRLCDFQTKSKKPRESVIVKLIHKQDSVAEELFDRIGIRFVTETRFDALRVLKFLLENQVIVPHNIKPSRSLNSLVDLDKLRNKFGKVLKLAIRNQLSEDRFISALERETLDCVTANAIKEERNKYSNKSYQSIQFTYRALIKYKNPFLKEFNNLRSIAKKEDSELAQKILTMDTAQIARDISFFYPFEIQIVDKDAYAKNTEGEASHEEYKKAQLRSAGIRLFRKLIDHTENRQ